MPDILIILFIFAPIIILTAYSGDSINWFYIITYLCTVFAIFAEVWKIVDHAFEKRDKRLDEALNKFSETKRHFEEFKSNYNHSFMMFCNNFKEIKADLKDIRNDLKE